MKLEPARRQIIDELMREAEQSCADQSGGVENREAAEAFLVLLDELEGSGRSWVADYAHDLKVTGTIKEFADRRRAQAEFQVKTAKGTEVSAPAFGAVRSTDDDGGVRYLQRPLAGMSLSELRALKERKARVRNTLSAEIQFYDALIETMEERNLATAGDALALLAAA